MGILVYIKRKQIAPRWSKLFPFRVDPFSEGTIYVQEGKQEVTIIASLIKMAGNSQMYPVLFNHIMRKNSGISKVRLPRTEWALAYDHETRLGNLRDFK